jgi:hypothetical protein
MDPFTIAAIIGAVGSVGAAAVAEAPFMGPSGATSNPMLTSDGSGFVVNTGGGRVDYNRSESIGQMPDWIWLAAIGAALYFFAE